MPGLGKPVTVDLDEIGLASEASPEHDETAIESVYQQRKKKLAEAHTAVKAAEAQATAVLAVLGADESSAPPGNG
jgi:hypothetical protein